MKLFDEIKLLNTISHYLFFIGLGNAIPTWTIILSESFSDSVHFYWIVYLWAIIVTALLILGAIGKIIVFYYEKKKGYEEKVVIDYIEEEVAEKEEKNQK